jgi:AmiR/NasT family two-component response regulator
VATVESLRAEALVAEARIAELAAEVEHLHTAMKSRADIEQAKGVLMHSMGIGPDAAFAMLVAASMRENVKVRDIAARIAAAQELTGEPLKSPSPGEGRTAGITPRG